MKKIYKLCTLILFLLPVLNLYAGDVDTLIAKKVAENFYNEKANTRRLLSSESKRLSHVMSKKREGKDVYHVYNVSDNKGFIIVSGDDRTVPVIGYSLEGNINMEEDAPPAFLEWMDARADEINTLKSIKSIARSSRNALWDKYLSDPSFFIANSTLDSYSGTEVSPLLESKWGQGCGYNAACPADASGACGHVYAGCVATAMAQVMKYHNYPPVGTGDGSYTSTNYGPISANYGATNYNWGGMPVPNGSYDADVEQLLLHCGVSVGMNYGPTGSGAYSSTVATSLTNKFNYTSNLVFTSRSSYADTNWTKLLLKELTAGRPVYYSGSGNGSHAFVLDGHQGTDYFHFNWGWKGSYNGYFYLDDLTPTSFNFTNSQSAIIGVEPPNSFSGLDCSNAIPLGCGVSYSGSTFGAKNIVNKYGNSYINATGNEVVHTFTIIMPGRISVKVNSTAKFRILLLNDSHQDSLVANSEGSLVYDNSLPGTYYLVLDGVSNDEGDYSVTVNCPTMDADLIFLTSKVTPGYIEPLQPNVHLDCEIKNIGNATAGTNKIKYYLSSDNILDGSDILLDSTDVVSTMPGESHFISKVITMPGGITKGAYYIIYELDADSEVVESDESLNTTSNYINVPDVGTMDCSVAVPLTSGVRYFGNTNTNGVANLQNYSCANKLGGKEIIHKLSAPYSGLATIEFSERVAGNMSVMVLPTCNENTCGRSLSIWNSLDTLVEQNISVVGGSDYYFVVDGPTGVNGDYSLMVTMPDSCPTVDIEYWGELNRCIGSEQPSLSADWGMSNFTWFMNGIKIEEASYPTYSPQEDGEYWVEVTENECTSASEHLVVTTSAEPDEAQISALGNTSFCHGNSVELELSTLGGYTVNWALNDEPIPGATSSTYAATESGIYTAQVTNISCTISSNSINVFANPLATDPGDALSMTADTGLVTYYEFNGTKKDLSGNNNNHYTMNGVTLEDNRFGDSFEAYSFNGENASIATTKKFTDPDEFTLSFWFKTFTTIGGPLAGFGNTNVGNSTVNDRHVYMSDNGKLHFGVDNGSAQTISSTAAYNDNNWHHIVACLSLSGMKLYVDGTLVDSDPTVTNGGDYSGYWRFANDNIKSGYDELPTSNYLNGILDEVKIFNWELSPTDVRIQNEEQIMTVSLTPNESCGGVSNADIVIKNSQPGVEYQLRDDTDNSFIGSAVVGTGGTIYLPTGTISSTTTFNIFATQIGSGCESELDSLFVYTVHELPVVSLGPDVSACDDTLLKDVSGVNYTAYSWAGGETTSQITATSSGTYTLSVVDSYGCENSDAIEVVINKTPSATINTTGTDCAEANGTATVVASGGSNAYSYIWDASIVDYSGAQASNLPAGKYDVTIDDGNCVLTKAFNIIGTGMPDISVSVSQESVCQGDSSHIQITGADSYSWSPAVRTSEIGSGEFYAEPETTTIYYISGISNGCTDEDTITIYVVGNPDINLGRDTLVCQDSYTIDAGSGFDTYLWSDGSIGQSLTINTAGAGYKKTVYSVKVTQNGCKNTDSIEVAFDKCINQIHDFAQNNWSCYPNPTSGMVTIESFEDINKAVRVIISDLGGNTIKDFEIPASSGSKKEIDLGNYTNEFFIIRIISEDKVYIGKIIKQ